MQIKTSELIGTALDWAVAKAEGLEVVHDPFAMGPDSMGAQFWVRVSRDGYHRIGGTYSPSLNWAQGGPIIAREDVEFSQEAPDIWRATIDPMEGDVMVSTECGPDHLTSAMRCYVRHALGDTVDVPEALL